MTWRGWGGVVAVSMLLAVVSLASNLTSVEQLSGQANGLLATRLTVSKLVNAGVVWAGLSVLAGWLVRRAVQACLAGVVAGLVALVGHYGLGQLFGVYGADIWASNALWFGAAAVMGGPLGFVGAVANWRGIWGDLARLVVPVGAIVEPLINQLSVSSVDQWPQRWSSLICGGVLLAGGVAGLWIAVRRRQSVQAVG